MLRNLISYVCAVRVSRWQRTSRAVRLERRLTATQIFYLGCGPDLLRLILTQIPSTSEAIWLNTLNVFSCFCMMNKSLSWPCMNILIGSSGVPLQLNYVSIDVIKLFCVHKQFDFWLAHSQNKNKQKSVLQSAFDFYISRPEMIYFCYLWYLWRLNLSQYI